MNVCIYIYIYIYLCLLTPLYLLSPLSVLSPDSSVSCLLSPQAEIYKADFLAEREAREKLNQKKEELQDQLTQAVVERDRLKQEATSRARMEQMKLRHLEDFPSRAPHIPPPQGESCVHPSW
ncbi:NF-kappa-B essential modulator [Liparis tanakae]|uniref:NF-kappa-B essential modulator n=1 Tax=Liparis tanakae TaxID=230148 RepID=A0A4Z2E2C5_9TELE|nr:NF-kappa-B essential modulator [Liparis tanakae]